MTVTRAIFRRPILACVLVLYLLPTAHGQIVAQPSNSKHAAKQGFFDYALGKVNPNNRDYGTELRSKRAEVSGGTIDDLYFWSNLLTLAMLAAAAGLLWLQWRSADQREVIAATLIAQLWNGRVSDRIEIARRTEQYNSLVEQHNLAAEAALTTTNESAGDAKTPETTIAKGVRRLSEKTTKPDGKESSAQLQLAIESPPRADAAELQQANLLLERRVEALQNSTTNLKQRLNQTTAQLEQERRRNSNLKGA